VNVGPALRPRANWAGNVAFQARDFRRPATVAQVQAVVARAGRVRALGSGHSFNDLADSPGVQLSLASLPPEVSVDSAARRARVAASLSYAELAGRLDEEGFALANLASLTNISVAGGTATATHGSGAANQNLAAAVSGLTLVTADGDVVDLCRGDGQFEGAVVHLGALGIVVSLILELVPSFEVSQRVYENLPLAALDDHFTEVMTGGYSVSLFTDWRAPRFTQVWIKQGQGQPIAQGQGQPIAQGQGQPIAHESWFTATPAPTARNPVPGASPGACTEQLGVPGRWYDRLPHFRAEFRPAGGDELQSEYLLPAVHAVPALRALDQIRDYLALVLRICEVRVVAEDQFWLSPCYRQDSVAFHFTWIPDIASVLPVVALVERQLAPFGARPHWGKIFTTPPETLREQYERLPDFLHLMDYYDPAGKFRNAYTVRHLGR
jgi:alditol oxidase